MKGRLNVGRSEPLRYDHSDNDFWMWKNGTDMVLAEIWARMIQTNSKPQKTYYKILWVHISIYYVLIESTLLGSSGSVDIIHHRLDSGKWNLAGGSNMVRM